MRNEPTEPGRLVGRSCPKESAADHCLVTMLGAGYARSRTGELWTNRPIFLGFCTDLGPPAIPIGRKKRVNPNSPSFVFKPTLPSFTLNFNRSLTKRLRALLRQSKVPNAKTA